MEQNRALRVVKAHYARATSKPHTYLKFYMSEENVMVWYVLLSGLGDEFAGGEYLLRIILPTGYPHKPPEFYLMTPNGLYGVEKKVCIDIGEFHSSNYPAVLGAEGFCAQLVSGLIGWREMTPGIAILKTDEQCKRELAQASVAYNAKHNAKFMDLIAQSYAAYSAKWAPAALP